MLRRELVLGFPVYRVHGGSAYRDVASQMVMGFLRLRGSERLLIF